MAVLQPFPDPGHVSPVLLDPVGRLLLAVKRRQHAVERFPVRLQLPPFGKSVLPPGPPVLRVARPEDLEKALFAIRSYLRIWMELVAQAADGDKSSGTIARQICDVFLDWTAQSLKIEWEAERLPTASLAFATIEGLVLLDALDDSEHIQQALQGIKIRG
jgi:hypothetical protein